MEGDSKQTNYRKKSDLSLLKGQPDDNTTEGTRNAYAQAVLADIRQQLISPTRALNDYAEIIVESTHTTNNVQVQDDANSIATAARSLSELVEGLVYEEPEVKSYASTSIEAERQLRHDLRTPINGILGLSELLIEDTDEEVSETLGSDLRLLIREAQQFLQQLETIVDFSRTTTTNTASVTGTDQRHAQRIGELVENMRCQHSAYSKLCGHILVVDDIATNRNLLKRRLEKDGHIVSMATDGHEALSKLQEISIDLVLLDLMMPGLNGFEVLQKMKAREALRNIPVIVISALGETEDAISCIEAGAHDYLPKPFNTTLLRARIQSGLENKNWSDSERQKREFVQSAFSRFLSPAVVNELVKNPDKLSLGGERVTITCLFTDLADFTALIEHSEPAAVLPILNRYLDGMCQIVLDHNGTIDKIVGDALHAFFGAPVEQANHATLATRCAIALDNYARDFVKHQEAAVLGFGHTRIGVHTGVAVVGNFGGKAFFDYTAHGDVINTTARIESVNKYLGTTLCISGDTVNQCKEMTFRPIGDLQLKGKEKKVAAYTPDRGVICTCPLDEYLFAYQLLSANRTTLPLFEQLHQRYPDDALVALHYQRQLASQCGNIIKFEGK